MKISLFMTRVFITFLCSSFSYADHVLFSCNNTGNHVVEVNDIISVGNDMQMMLEYRLVHKPTVQYLLDQNIIHQDQLQADGSFKIRLRNMTGRGGTLEFLGFEGNFAFVSYAPHSADVSSLQYIQIGDLDRTRHVNIDLCY